jgi:hypothetical protein
MLFDLGLEDLLASMGCYFPGNLGRLGGAIIEERKNLNECLLLCFFWE